MKRLKFGTFLRFYVSLIQKPLASKSFIASDPEAFVCKVLMQALGESSIP